MNITLKRTVDLSSPILPEVLSAPLYEGEKNAHTFVIAAIKNKLPHPLSGSVVAYFDRADGNTVRVEGETRDGAAYVTLPPECYQTGVFYLAVMLISDGAQTVIYAASGRVKNTQEGEIINGGDAIPTYDEIMAHLNKYLNANISAKVEQKEDGALITMTDADGTTQAFVRNGKDGSGTGGGSGDMPAPYYITIEKVADANGYKTSDDFDYAEMVNAYKQGRPIYITRNPFDTQTEMYAELVKLYDSRAIFAEIDPNGLSIVTVYSDTSALINGGNVTYKGQKIVGAVNNIQPTPTSFVGGIFLKAADIPDSVLTVNGQTPDENGNVKIDTNPYTLPTMSESTKGGAKVGAGLKMEGEALTINAGDGLEVVDSALRVKPESEYELIEKIIIGYELLTEQPEDWETNWTAYYRNTGTNKEPTYTLINDASAPAWGTSSYFKLIDDYGIDQIIRDTDPNGNPYKLEALMTTTKINGNENFNIEHLYLFVCPGSNNYHWTSVGMPFYEKNVDYDTRTYTRKNKGTWELYGYHGMHSAYSQLNGQTTCGDVELTADKKYITWLRIFVSAGKLPRNMVIEIWGVRAQ